MSSARKKQKDSDKKEKKRPEEKESAIGARHLLVSSGKKIITPEEPGDHFSSNELPLGMTNQQFGVLCYEIFEEFDRSNFLTDYDYSPPTHLFFKGSSATSVSYNPEKEGKRFSDTSDYDAGLVWPDGVHAMAAAAFEAGDCALKDYLKPEEVDGMHFLNLHSKDTKERKDQPHLKYFFPNGMPHKNFCEFLKAVMKQDHPINFVVLQNVHDIQLNPTLLGDPSKLDQAELQKLRAHLRDGGRYVSEDLAQEFMRKPATAQNPHGQVLVYSWKLVKVYHDAYAKKAAEMKSTTGGAASALFTHSEKQADERQKLQQAKTDQVQAVKSILPNPKDEKGLKS